ncbi:MAG TPA: hypothetical protein VK211_01925 [Kamptonema sp.]|nr:hypothetical protein [Kamptonema sp.]
MNNESLKLELIQWILLMKDIQVLNNIKSMKNFHSEKTIDVQPRQFGCGQGIFTNIADDFDATPPGFEEYMLP